MKILVASGSPSMRTRLQGATEVLGHGMLEAQSEAELFQVLPAHYPDIALIVLDGELAGARTPDVLRRIRGDERCNPLPILVLLPEKEEGGAIRAFQAGATDCLAAAMLDQDLVTRMLECLSRAA